MNKIVYNTGNDCDNHWFYNKYNKGNSRYWTFNIALNLLVQKHHNPTIIETGCQRQKDDLGAGMSTSIFAEYIYENDGELIVVDNDQQHLNTATECISEWMSDINASFHCLDSVTFLRNYSGTVDLLYLDSYDYPYGDMLRKYNGQQDIHAAEKILQSKSHTEIISEFKDIVIPCQEHCLNEFKAIESNLSDTSIVLIDDNRLPGGGKPRLAKQYLYQHGWTCLLDYQQTLWVKTI